jgi:hypothetical protein
MTETELTNEIERVLGMTRPTLMAEHHKHFPTDTADRSIERMSTKTMRTNLLVLVAERWASSYLERKFANGETTQG